MAIFLFSVPARAADSTLDHVLQSKILKCGYLLWPDLMEKDPNTGAMKGVFVDITEEVAKSMGVKVQWVTEVTGDDFISMVNSGKVDAICAPIAPIASMRSLASFSIPVFYIGFDLYVRADDNRFDTGLPAVDKPDISVLSLDGSAAREVANAVFPHAHHSSLLATLAAGQTFLDVISHKADATVSDQLTAARYMETHPGKLKQVRWSNRPLLSAGGTPFITRIGDLAWTNVLDGTLHDLIDTGVIDRIMTQHHMVAGQHYNALALPYRSGPSNERSLP